MVGWLALWQALAQSMPWGEIWSVVLELKHTDVSTVFYTTTRQLMLKKRTHVGRREEQFGTKQNTRGDHQSSRFLLLPLAIWP